MRQGRRSVIDYATEFRTLAVDSGWTQPALVDAFFNGLSEHVKDLLTPLDLPSELDALVSLASKIDKRLLERDRIRSVVQPVRHLCWYVAPPVRTDFVGSSLM